MKFKWLKKILAGTVSAAMCCGMLSGCGREIKQTNEELNLYITEAYYFQDYVSYPLQIYQKKYPDVKVNVNIVWEADEATYFDSLAGSLMTGKDIPDLLFANLSFAQYCDISKMEQSGAFIDLNTMLAEDAEYNEEDFYSTVIEKMKYGDKQYLFPLSFNLPYLASTEERLEKLGVTVEEFQSLTVLDFFELIGQKQQELGMSVDDIVSGRLKTSLYFNASADESRYGAFYPSMYCPDIVDYAERSYHFPKEQMQSLFENMIVLNESASNRDYYDSCMYMIPRTNLLGIEDYFAFEHDDETPVLTCLRNMDGGINASVWLSASIPVLSSNQQNAYNFLKIMLSEEIQNYKFDKTLSVQFSPVHTPVRKGRFISNYSPFANKKYEGIWAADTEYRESVTNVFVNSECAKILDEEYKAYASGNSSAADAVESVEKKLKIYVSE